MDIIDKIKAAKTMEDMDNIRMDVVKSRTNESVQLWQKKYRRLKCFRKPADVGYNYKYL